MRWGQRRSFAAAAVPAAQPRSDAAAMAVVTGAGERGGVVGTEMKVWLYQKLVAGCTV
jgi:hypothetical protein